MLNFKVNESSYEELKRQSLIDAYANFLKGYGWNYFITLNFRRNIKEERAQEIAEKFVKKLNIEVFGKRSKKAVKLAVSIEKNMVSGYHLHVLAVDPSPRIGNKDKQYDFDFCDVVRKCWQDADASTALINLSSPDRHSWFQVIENENNVIRYVLKEMKQGRYECLQANLVNLEGRRWR